MRFENQTAQLVLQIPFVWRRLVSKRNVCTQRSSTASSDTKSVKAGYLFHLWVRSLPGCRWRRIASESNFNAEISTTFQLDFFVETAAVNWRRDCNKQTTNWLHCYPAPRCAECETFVCLHAFSPRLILHCLVKHCIINSIISKTYVGFFHLRATNKIDELQFPNLAKVFFGKFEVFTQELINSRIKVKKLIQCLVSTTACDEKLKQSANKKRYNRMEFIPLVALMHTATLASDGSPRPAWLTANTRNSYVLPTSRFGIIAYNSAGKTIPTWKI